jgi:hypothetical protein
MSDQSTISGKPPPTSTIQKRPPDAPHETETLARNIASANEYGAVAMASLIHLTRSLIQERERTSGLSLALFTRLQDDCEKAWMTQNGVKQSSVDAAVKAISQAHGTIAYIDSLPN